LPLSRRVSLRLLLGITLAALSVVFLWHFPWRKSLSAIAGAHWGAIGLALVAKAVAVFARAERVHAMLHRVLRVGRGMLVRYVFCGFAADNLLASTAGVAARTWLVVRHGGAPLRRAVGALMLEKWLDGCVMGAGIWATVHFQLIPVRLLEPSFVVAYGIGLFILVFALVAGRRGSHTRLGRFFQPAADALGDWKDTTRTLVMTVSVWVLEGLVLYATLRAVGLACGIREVVVLTTAGTLAFVLPGLPSGAGTFEASLVFGLRALGLDDEHALSVALLYHAVQVLPETVAGLWALKGMRLRLVALENGVNDTEMATS
jgi:glycosyltransferase 2 family protein